MKRRLAYHDLDETIFHETAHLALDPMLSQNSRWKTKQKSDGEFITSYAANNPHKEDIAESALFAWITIFRPGRLPRKVKNKVRTIMPNRLEYLNPPACEN